MAQQQLRKRRLEENLGFNQVQTIKSGFDQETIDIVRDIMSKKCELRDHPLLIKHDEQSKPKWVFFLVVHDLHPAIWAVEEKYMQNLDVLAQEYLTPYDSGECLKASSVIRRFHIALREEDHYDVVADDLYLHGKEPQFDICLYVGTLTLSLRELKVIMAMIAGKKYVLLRSDCIEYCKQFVYIYFDLIEEEINNEQTAVLEKLTVTTNALSASSERPGRRNRSSGFSLRTFLTSPFVQVYLAALLAGLTLFIAYKFLTIFDASSS